jgi:hypothetical protein
MHQVKDDAQQVLWRIHNCVSALLATAPNINDNHLLVKQTAQTASFRLPLLMRCHINKGRLIIAVAMTSRIKACLHQRKLDNRRQIAHIRPLNLAHSVF